VVTPSLEPTIVRQPNSNTILAHVVPSGEMGLTDESEDLEKLYHRGKTAVRGAAVKLATDAVKWLEDWQKPKTPRYRSDLLTEAEYATTLEHQGGVCAICGDKPKSGRLHVDHIHGTDRVRGLLCSLCNPALGLFKDDPVRLAKAIEYLERGGDNSP